MAEQGLLDSCVNKLTDKGLRARTRDAEAKAANQKWVLDKYSK